MPPDPVRAIDARAWLAKAAQDLRRVGLLLAADPPAPASSPGMTRPSVGSTNWTNLESSA
jgi:hypothetical protein